jgi:hypothetical protein
MNGCRIYGHFKSTQTDILSGLLWTLKAEDAAAVLSCSGHLQSTARR